LRRRRTDPAPLASAFGSALAPCLVLLVPLALLGCAVAGSPPAAPSDGASGAAHADAEARAVLDRADLALARGDGPAAERDYLEVLEAWPEDPWALAGLVRVALAAGDAEAALAWDERARVRDGEVPGGLGAGERCALWLSVAEDRLQAGSLAARELVDRIEQVEACPKGDLPRLRAQLFLLDARMAHASGDIELALAACGHAIEADPARVDADLAAARWLLAEGRRREALAWLSSALERHPDDEDLRRLMLEALGVPGLGA